MGTITFILIVLALIIGMCFLEGGEGYTSDIFRSFIIRILCVYPIFIGSLAIANFWVVLLKIDSMAPAMYIFSLALSEGIIANLGTDVFPRVKIGVGAPKGNLVSHVLGKFSDDEVEILRETIKASSDAVSIMISKDTKEAMNKLNGFNAGKEK